MKNLFSFRSYRVYAACLFCLAATSSYAQSNPAIVDDLIDFSKIHSYSPQVRILSDEVDIEKFDFDTVLEMNTGSASNSYLIYKNNVDIQTILIHGYRYRTHDAELKFYLSDAANGIYTDISDAVTFRIGPKQAFTNWTHIIYELNDVGKSFPGKRFLKITWGNGSWKNSPVIGSVNINADADTDYVGEFCGYTIPRFISETKKHSHPRVRMNLDDFGNVKKWVADGNNPDLTKAVTTALTNADKELEKPLIERTLDNNGYLLTTSREMLSRMEKLGIGYQLSEDAAKKTQYVAKAYADLEAAAGWVDWKPDHFLDVAEMTAAFAMAYDWMYDAFSATQKEVICRAIVNQGLKKAWDAYSGRCVWYGWENNMNTVNNSGIMMGALAILGDVAGEDESLCGKILLEGMKSIQSSMTGYAPAGGYKEGPAYWAYGTKYLVWLITSLQKSLENDLELLSVPGLKETGCYPAHVSGGWDKRNFNYADSNEDKYSWMEVWWFAKQYKDAALAQYCKADKKNIYIPYYAPEVYNATGAMLTKSHYFKGPELFFTRNIWDGNANAWTQWLGFKAGTPQVAHGDMDMGTFVIDALGDRWACDLGSEDYNASDIWDWQGKNEGKRYNYYRKNPEGHNCVLINPDATQHQDALAFSPVIETSISDEVNYAIADLTPAYNKKTSSYKRGVKTITDKIALNRDRVTFIIQDEIENRTSNDELYWFMHTKQTVSITAGGKEAVLTNTKNQMNKMIAKILSPAHATFEIMDAKALPGSRKPSGKDADNSSVKKLSIHLSGVDAPTTICVAFIPVRTSLKYGGEADSDPVSEDWPSVIPLDEWKTGTALIPTGSPQEVPFTFRAVNGKLEIQSTSELDILSAWIYDTTGMLISTLTDINTRQVSVDIPRSGLYLVRAATERSGATGKLYIRKEK